MDAQKLLAKWFWLELGSCVVFSNLAAIANVVNIKYSFLNLAPNVVKNNKRF